MHNPPNLAGIRAAMEVFGDVPHTASFDTAFHTTMPKSSYLYAIPMDLYERHRVRRYGFHGTSHRYVARRYAELAKRNKYAVNVITCHLGNGASITAVKDGHSLDTSMGLTPLEGLVMGTRSGDVDPALPAFMDEHGMNPQELNTLLNKKSGLLGVSGVSNDMREVLDAKESGDQRAALAFDIFCYRLRKYIGAYAAALGRLDAVIFTGGIGENSPEVRQHTLANLPVLGIELDTSKNRETNGTESQINTPDSRVELWIIPTNEELRIAVDAYRRSLK